MPHSKIVYIAGPMRGYDNFNFPAFWAAEAQLMSSGYECINPAHNGPQTINDHMTQDAAAVARADLVAVLPGWEDSQGARLEVMMANYLGVPVYHAASLYPDAPMPAVRVVANFILNHDNVHDGEVVDKQDNPVVPDPEEAKVLRRIPPIEEQVAAKQQHLRYREVELKLAKKTRFEELLQQMQELHDRKKSDYTAGNADILHNYRTSGELAGISLPQSIFARLSEKVIRVSSILKKGGNTAVSDETVMDTCLDLAIISLLLRIAFEEVPSVTAQGHAVATA